MNASPKIVGLFFLSFNFYINKMLMVLWWWWILHCLKKCNYLLNLRIFLILKFFCTELISACFQDPFREWRGHFQYATLLKHLKRLKSKIEVKEDTEVPENPITAESDDVSSISEGEDESLLYEEESSPELEGVDWS